MTEAVDKEKWVSMQHKTFKNWSNYWLKSNDQEPIENLDTDLQDGIKLIKLVEALTEKPLPKYKDPARLRVQRINNINIALKGLSDSGVRLTISAEQITDGDLKMILGLFWMMIQNFQIQAGGGGGGKGKSAKDSILEWVREFLGPDYPIDLKDFPNCFKDGVIFNYLVHRKDPNLIDLNELKNSSPRENLVRAFHAAEKLGVPQLLDVDDVLQGPDEQSILTYLSTFRSKVKDPYANMVAEVSALRSVLEQNQNQEAKEREAQFKGELTELKEQLKNQSSKMEENQLQQMKELQEELKSNRKELKDLEAANMVQKNEIQDLSRKLEAEMKSKSSAQAEKDSVEAELERLKKKMKDDARSRAMAGGEAAMMENELEDLRSQLEEAKRKKKNYKKLHQDDLEALEKKSKDLKALEQENIKIDLELKEAKRNEQQHAKEKDKLKNQIQDLQQKLKDTEAERDQLQDSRPATGGGFQDRIRAQKLQGELEDLKKKYDHTHEKSKDRKAKLRELEAEVEELNRKAKQNAGNQEELDQLKQEIERLKDELKREKEKNKKLQEELEKEKDARSTAEEEIERLKLELATREDEKKRAHEQIQELEAKLEVIPSEPYEFEGRNEERQQMERELENLKNELKESNDDRRKNRDEVEELLKKLDHQKDSYEQSKNAHQEEVKQLRDQLENQVGADDVMKALRDRKDALQNENENLKDQNNRLQDDIQDLQDKNDKLNKENQELHDKNKGLEDKVHELEDLRDELLETIAQLEAQPAGGNKNLDLELLVRELYYRKGARVSYHHLREIYEDDRTIEDFCLDARDKLTEMVQDAKAELKDEESENKQSEEQLVDLIDQLNTWKKELKQLQSEWVVTANELGELYEPKTQVENDLDDWRKKLVKIADSPKRMTEEEENIPDFIEDVKKLLDEDDKNVDEIRKQRPVRKETKLEVEEQLFRVHNVIYENLSLEIERLKGINKNEFDDEPDVSGDTASVVELMIENYQSLFQSLMTSPKNKEVHQLVSHSVAYLKAQALRTPDILLKEEYKPYAVQQIKSYAYRGFAVDLKSVKDHYVVAALLKDYFKELREPLLTFKLYSDFLQIAALPENKATLKELGDLIKALPVLRRATLTILVGFLHALSKKSSENHCTAARLGSVFGPLLLKAPPKKKKLGPK